MRRAYKDVRRRAETREQSMETIEIYYPKKLIVNRLDQSIQTHEELFVDRFTRYLRSQKK